MAIPGFNEPFPYEDRIVGDDGRAAKAFVDWLDLVLQPRIQASPIVTETAARVLDGNAAVAATPIGGEQTQGLYRLTYYAEVLVSDGVSQSLQLTIIWTHNGKTLTRTYAAMTALPNTTTQGFVDAIDIDGGTTVSYALAYASNTPGAFRYCATVALELVQLLS